MFENMPGVALQIYAALTGEGEENSSLMVSILFTVALISYSVWMYLVKLTSLNRKASMLENGQMATDLEDNDQQDIPQDDATAGQTQTVQVVQLQVKPVNTAIQLAVIQGASGAEGGGGNNRKTTDVQDEDLPVGWRIAFTDDGKKYYQNDTTKETRWDKHVVISSDNNASPQDKEAQDEVPKDEEPKDEEPKDEEPKDEELPHGWRVAYTEDGKKYYQNDTTKETKWEKPEFDKEDKDLPDGWRIAYTDDGKKYYQNDTTKQTQWTRPETANNNETDNDKQDDTEKKEEKVQPVAVALNEDDSDEEDDYVKAKADEKAQDDDEQDNDKNDGMDRKETMTPEEVAYEEGMEKLKQSKFIPAFIRNQFADVLINRVLYTNLYAFMLTDFYIRSVPLIVIIASIPCPKGESFCYARLGTGAALFSILLIFEFIWNKRMRIPDYQKCGFILTVFAVSILSSFYTILSSLHLLRNDKFFGKCVNFNDFMFEHKVRIYLSVFMNLINILLFFVNDAARNEFVLVLLVVFFIALAFNYFAINKIQRFVNPPNQYPFKLLGCSNKNGAESYEETKKTPVVAQQNNDNNVEADAAADGS